MVTGIVLSLIQAMGINLDVSTSSPVPSGCVDLCSARAINSNREHSPSAGKKTREQLSDYSDTAATTVALRAGCCFIHAKSIGEPWQERG